jgi:hypothetical protein
MMKSASYLRRDDEINVLSCGVMDEIDVLSCGVMDESTSYLRLDKWNLPLICGLMESASIRVHLRLDKSASRQAS